MKRSDSSDWAVRFFQFPRLYEVFKNRTKTCKFTVYTRDVQTILPKEPNYMGTKNSSIQNVYKNFGHRSQIWFLSHRSGQPCCTLYLYAVYSSSCTLCCSVPCWPYKCECLTNVCCAMCRNQKLLLPEWTWTCVRQSSESGALSLSSTARYIDFHSSRRIYVAFSACHSAFTTNVRPIRQYFKSTKLWEFDSPCRNMHILFFLSAQCMSATNSLGLWFYSYASNMLRVFTFCLQYTYSTNYPAKAH